MSTATVTEQTIRAMPKMSRLCIEHDPDVFRSVLDRVGDKWSLLIIGILGERPHRFTELARQTPGISRRMLTNTLRALERDGLVKRTVYAEVPPRVVYEVTRLGVSLGEPVLQLATWVARNQGEIVDHRSTYDRANDDVVGAAELASSSRRPL